MYKESITCLLSGQLGQLTASVTAIDKLTYSKAALERGPSFRYKINQPCHCCRVKGKNNTQQHYCWLTMAEVLIFSSGITKLN